MHPTARLPTRRCFLSRSAIAISPLVAQLVGRSLWAAAAPAQSGIDPLLAKDWLARWQKSILADERNRYCDKETGEELGWLVSPFVNGFYFGYLATHDAQWLDRMIDWSDAWIHRGVKEPDGQIGWPKEDGASTSAEPGLFTDNILGEAMALTPLAGFANLVRKTPTLQPKYDSNAMEYLALCERIFSKWDSRGCWREIETGGVWVVPPFGIDKTSNSWTDGYVRRKTDGFTLPPNKQNLIALWLLAMHDATDKLIYRERAEKWFRTMKSRIRTREDKYLVWNYWDPAGPWDRKPDGQTRHWVGVHPNGGYYGIDLEGIVAAYEHRLVFKMDDIQRLIATNRDFMWNGKTQGAAFRSIGGEAPDPRWKDSPGVLWTALVPYDNTLRKIFEANHKPDSWGGTVETPWYLSLGKV